MTHIADMLVADDKLSLLRLMTKPCVTPSPTSPCNVPGDGDVLCSYDPLIVMEDDNKKH